MNDSFNWVFLIFLLGATQGIFLALILLNKPGNKTANRFLAFLMIAYSVFILETLSSGSTLAEHFPHLIGLGSGFIFLATPLLFLYVRAMTKPGYTFSGRQLLHFLPFLGFYLSMSPFYLKSGPDKLDYFKNLMQTGPTIKLIIVNWGIIIQGIIYLAFILLLLKKHAVAIRATFSSLELINLRWLRNITIMTLALWLLGFVVEFIQLFDYATSVQISVPIMTALLIYIMGYLGLRQPEIFAGDMPVKELKKYERSGLSKEKAREIHQKLVSLMETKKPYTDPNLKLGQLAKMLSTTPNYLSQVINDGSKQNFFDFINAYRIEEAKNLMTDASYQQMTLLSIAYDVGFNSKSAFNAAFKKHTRMTPTGYKKSVAG